MKRILTFLKATLLGGVIVVLPAWLAAMLVLKALGHLQVFVKPITSHLPDSVAHPRIIAADHYLHDKSWKEPARFERAVYP